MNLSRCAGPELLPPEDPPDGLVDPDLRSRLEQRMEVERRLLLWTAALATAFEREDGPPIRGAYLNTYGFLDPELETDAFGVIVHAEPLLGTVSGVVRSITIGPYSFPVAVRCWPYIPHAPTIHPQNGRSACWARRRADGKVGLLTVKHVLDQAMFPNVNLVDARGNLVIGTVLAEAPDSVDAALIEPPGGPVGLTGQQVNVMYLIAQWTRVDVAVASGTITTRVASVTDVRGNYGTSYHAARLFLGQAGQPGDSGSLVFVSGQQDYGISGNGEWLALYAGEQTSPLGQSEGVCQHLGQVIHQNVMDLEVLE